MDKKRILVFTESYLPSVGGLENNTLLLCQTLNKLGHLVTLITPQKNALSNTDFSVISSSNLFKYFKYVWDSDLIIINGGVSFKAILPSLFFNKAYLIIYQMASLFTHIHNSSFKLKIANKLRKYLANKAKQNIGVSRYSFEVLTQIFSSDKSALLINPANPIFNPKEVKIKEYAGFNCLFAGRLIEGKGLKLLIEAIESLRKEGLIFNLHIIGEGPLEGYIRNKLSLGYIYLYPPASSEDLKKWFRKVDLTVIPSTSHIEGSPLVMAESLVMGTPVLVANQPAMVTALNHENMFFISGDLSNLILRLRMMLNPEIYSEILNHTKSLSKDYYYENYFNQLKIIVNV